LIVLGIESTCDETGCAIVENGQNILANVVASQQDLHERYGGVFPELASRRHVEVIIPVIEKAFALAEISPQEIDLISVAKGPGLIGALMVGINTAKGLAFAWQKPLIGVNHVEAHLYASMMDFKQNDLPFPALGIVISGGHTFMVKIHSMGNYELIGTTQDDAIGEAFDKVAVMLGLPYPGGPSIEKLSLLGDPNRFRFKTGVVKEHPFDFSFSGIKTNVLYTIKSLSSETLETEKKHIAASFQEAVFTDIVKKSLKAVEHFECKGMFFGGGVSQNERLKAMFAASFPPFPIFWPSKSLCLDNAAMIAGLGYQKFLNNPISDSFHLEPSPRISLL
jgi:N6-L-threonylcarbamoyladenine synthase